MERDEHFDLVPRPDDLAYARMGRLAILLVEVPELPNRRTLDIERLSIYDFFVDNPLLILGEGTLERREILLAGFQAQTFSYHSSSQRFSNRRARIQHDLARLLSLDLIRADASSGRVAYAVTDVGKGVAEQLVSSYADGYRASVRIVARALNKLPDIHLRSRTREWLRADPFLVDLYAD